MSTKNMEIERLRAIAVLMVIVTHSAYFHPVLPALFRTAVTGVDLFFVISGYVVTLSLLRSLPQFSQGVRWLDRVQLAGGALKGFYLRRIFRILPAAFFWAALYFLLAVFYTPGSSYLFGTPSHLFKEFSYFVSGFYNYLKYPDLSIYYLGHYWSLAVEEHFYFILPILFVLVSTNRQRIVACFIGILVVIFVLRSLPVPELVNPVAWNTQASHRRFDTLLMGVVLALLSSNPLVRGKQRIKLTLLDRIWAGWFLPTLFLLMLWVFPVTLPAPFNVNLGHTVCGLMSLGLVFLAVWEQGFIFSVPVLNKFLEYVGSRSYALYLCHVAFIELNIQAYNDLGEYFPAGFLDSHGGLWLRFGAVLLASLIASEFTYRCVEQPMIRYGKKFIA